MKWTKFQTGWKIARVILQSLFALWLAASYQPVGAQDEIDPLPDLVAEAEAPPAATLREPLADKASRLKMIETERNSYTFSRQTLAQGQKIAEISYSYIKIGKEAAKHSYPEFIGRYGVTDDFEFRFGYNLESGNDKQAAESEALDKFGINSAQQAFYGFKYQVSEQLPGRRWVPDSDVMINGVTPIASIPSTTQISAGYAFGWELSNEWNLDAAVKWQTDRLAKDHYDVWSPSAVLKIPFGRQKKWFTHIEYFGLYSSGKRKEFCLNLLDSGLHYFLTPNWEIGTIVGFGLTPESQGLFLNFGSGLRF